MDFDKEIIERLELLQDKYAAMGQDMKSYLDGLLYSDPLNYWNYIQLDTLLSLQHPKTDFPDEEIFIMYHQITELYFKLSLHELNQIANNGRIVLKTGEDKGWNTSLNVDYFIERLKRINNYFKALIGSFDVMITGMEKDQFLRFRMSLLPASGFQSAQYRMIEICSTDFLNLVDQEHRENFKHIDSSQYPIEDMFEFSYWKKGAMELESGKKTLTLKQFERKYTEDLLETAYEYQNKNLWAKFCGLPDSDKKNEELVTQMRQLDVNVNINWPLSHYKSAVRYLHQKNSDIAATGGTNWQKYLPPRFQKRIFYPELWSENEKNEWGKAWVEDVVKEK